MTKKILASVACNLDKDLLAACLPLLQEERVEAIEWSFDSLFDVREIPDWFLDLLQAYSKEGRLIGHGVFFSLFSGRWSREQAQWLQHLQNTSRQFHFDHVTEHFGFMTGKDFHHGAPLNVPFSETVLNIGRDRIARIYEACGRPVGIENLAFAYSVDEVKAHGEFLEKLVQPVNGFLILDLHNLYCQSHNFSVSPLELLKRYPLHRVREIHISGGSWQQSETDADKKIRRDTHDNAVPNEVFDLLETALSICPQLKYVVLEQLGTALKTPASHIDFYDDFTRMEKIVNTENEKSVSETRNDFLPRPGFRVASDIVEDEMLHQQQIVLSEILENAVSLESAVNQIQNSKLAHSVWQVESWDMDMIDAAMKIAQKWKKRP